MDGLAKASILDIDGVAVPAGSVNVPPLDTYTGAAAAYSVRLLRTAYTGDIMRVRRTHLHPAECVSVCAGAALGERHSSIYNAGRAHLHI